MEALNPSEDQIEGYIKSEPVAKLSGLARAPLIYTIYAIALAVSISTWFIALRAPLWIDETGTYWQICAGFSQIWPRHFITLSSPEYAYILWLSTKLIGTSEIALRIPSILAMLAAVYLLYLAARELFERDIAIIAVVIFCLHPVIAFAAIDARPYAFAALTTCMAILILFRLSRDNSMGHAALFGLTAACIVWFQFLFIDMLPALLLCFFMLKRNDRNILLRQFGIALVAFTVAFLPVVPLMINLARSGQAHVGQPPPSMLDFLWTLAPGWLIITFCITGFVAFLSLAVRKWHRPPIRFERSRVLICASLALIPILILFGISEGTSIHAFEPRYRLDAIPGIALCWAFLLSRFQSRLLRLLFTVTLVIVTASFQFSSSLAKHHETSWKYALEAAEKNASPDNAPVLVCSGFIEADYETVPLDSAKESKLFAPLAYYKLSVPVIPLPRALNEETVRVGSVFLRQAAQKRERFLAFADTASYKTLDWLAQNAATTHSVRVLGKFDGVVVMEFDPRPHPAPKMNQ